MYRQVIEVCVKLTKDKEISLKVLLKSKWKENEKIQTKITPRIARINAVQFLRME